jgi:DNA-binding SARP family transcriptional activator/tetratricopeptide (TPR) repeat protein
VEFRLLGPLEVAEQNRVLELGALKQRSLLAVLLLHANEVVPVERLVDELWGESPPATVGKSVQVYVSRLRKQLGDGRLITRAPGYLLRVDPSELDLARFERLVDEAGASDPVAAARKLSEALALWRGPPLADLAYEPFAQPEIARLEELRLQAVEQRIDAVLAIPGHAQPIGELEALVAEHPLRERLRGQLMLALYRSGRQAEALDAFHDARAALTEQLGIEPSRALRELHEAILRQDAGLDAAPASAPAREPDRGGVFVGRERELGELQGALEEARAGRGRVVLLHGEPGIGKTRLADELAGRARGLGVRVLVGRCWEAGGAPAYWPWAQALRAHVRETDAAELRELFGDLPAAPGSASEGARFRLFDAACSLIRSAAESGPLLLVLDDMHAADEPSLLLLQFVAREIAGSPVLVLCAFRDVDPALGEPLLATLGELVREPRTLQVAPAGLGAGGIAEYIERSTGVEPSARLVAAIDAETEGNPLFVGELVRLLEGEGRLADADADLRIPPGVRAVIGRRMRRMPQRCQELLAAASVLGREFHLGALALLCGLERDELLDALDDAIAERVVTDVPGAPGSLRFGHALIRDTLYDELGPARRLRLHERAGAALERLYAADPEPHLAELALHFVAAGSAAKALDYSRRSGDRAASQLAFEEAARHYETALALDGAHDSRCDLLLALGDVRARAGDTPASRAAFREAAALAERDGMPDLLARAAIGYGGRLMWEVARDDEHIVPLLERAIAALGDADPPLRVRLLVRLAGGPLRDSRFPPERKAAMSAEALEIARRIGDPATVAYAIHGYILGHHSPDHTRRQLELATEMIALARAARDKEREFEGHEERLVAFLDVGDMGGFAADLEAMTQLAGELRQPAFNWLVTVYRALLALLQGKLDEAEVLVATAHAQGERAHRWSADVSHRLQLYVLRREQGRLADVAEVVRGSPRDYPTYPIFRCVAAHLEAELGNSGAARAALEELAADGFAALPFDEEWLVGMCLLAEAATWLGDSERASAIHALLLPYADRIAVSYPEIALGCVARYLGLAATAAGRGDDAEAHLRHAIEVDERIGARRAVARGRADLQRLMRSRPPAPQP